MKRSTFLGSAVSVLLLFSAISYSRTFIQQQDPKIVQPKAQPVQSSNQPASTVSTTSPVGAESARPASGPAAGELAAGPASFSGPATEKPVEKTIALNAQTYTVTAYSLRGRTASR